MKSLRPLVRNINVQAHATWLCARDAELGWGPRLMALAIAGYALSPIDLIPDFMPVIGLLDNALLIPLGIWLFRKMVPPHIFARHVATAETTADRPVSRGGAIAIVALWIAAALGCGYYLQTRGWF